MTIFCNKRQVLLTYKSTEKGGDSVDPPFQRHASTSFVEIMSIYLCLQYFMFLIIISM